MNKTGLKGKAGHATLNSQSDGAGSERRISLWSSPERGSRIFPVQQRCRTGGQGEAESHISTEPSPTVLSPGKTEMGSCSIRNYLLR